MLSVSEDEVRPLFLLQFYSSSNSPQEEKKPKKKLPVPARRGRRAGRVAKRFVSFDKRFVRESDVRRSKETSDEEEGEEAPTKSTSVRSPFRVCACLCWLTNIRHPKRPTASPMMTRSLSRLQGRQVKEHAAAKREEAARLLLGAGAAGPEERGARCSSRVTTRRG
jgi:hypothetical protein